MALASESALLRNPRRLGPPQPNPATLTFKPVRPKIVYSIDSNKDAVAVDSTVPVVPKFKPGMTSNLDTQEMLFGRLELSYSHSTRIPSTSPVARSSPAAVNEQLTHALRPSILMMRARNWIRSWIGVGFR